MKDSDCVGFLQWALPRLHLRWPGFRKVRRQVCKRVDRRIRQLGLPDANAYRDFLVEHQQEWSVLDSFCRISISRFYRDRGVFDYLHHEIFEKLVATARASGDHTLRGWSAGCASGEEAYTLNIMWKRCFRSRFPEMSLVVIGTDSDPNMLDRARRGCYLPSSLKDIPKDWTAEVFTKEDELFCLKAEFREGVEFSCQDIRHANPEGQFHLILCRHLVFTYFDNELQQEMLQRIEAKLVPGGILVTGKQEGLPVEMPSFQHCDGDMGVYQKSS